MSDAEKQDKPKLVKQNDVTQPREGSKTRRVWEIADDISAKEGRPALRGEVMDAGKEEDLSPGTIATQYGRWCTFHGVTSEQLKEVRASQKTEEEAA